MRGRLRAKDGDDQAIQDFDEVLRLDGLPDVHVEARGKSPHAIVVAIRRVPWTRLSRMRAMRLRRLRSLRLVASRSHSFE